MYERFTDTARKAMQFANKAAQRCHHEYIGAEHILLGIVDEGSGAALTVLKNLNVDPSNISLEVEKIVLSGLEMTMGNLPQTRRAKKIIEYAMEEARDLKHDYVGTEHLLLGLIREFEGVAGQTLYNFGVELDDARREVVELKVREPRGREPRETETRNAAGFVGARTLGRFVGQVARAIGLSGRLRDRSAIVAVDSKQLEKEIERLTVAKEEAIANRDFQEAARLRDQADELKRNRDR
jgi:ATP-dependent Clp protease ATP-binding subunit ClpC